MSNKEMLHVSTKEAGLKLLSFLKERYAGKFSVKQLKRLIDAKGCKINGKVEPISTRTLNIHDKIQVDIGLLSNLTKPAKFSCEILYEDDAFLICNKCAGIVCEDKVFQDLFQNKSLFLVHRLDKDTTGVLILAKAEDLREKMIPLFREKSVKKTYLAIVDGVPKKETGKMDTFLEKKLEIQGKTIYGSSENKRGKQAVTYWKLLKKGGDAALLLCEPITGRTHQLRVHLSESGHPILGDHTYAKRFKSSFSALRHLLHAYSITFIHPTTKKELKTTAKPPIDFLSAMKTLKLA